MINIILCGGNGTRLWSLSRTLMPKQFIKLFNDKSLFQLTVERNKNICNEQFVVSNAEQYFLAVDQLEELNNNSQFSSKQSDNYTKMRIILDSQFLLEPIGRNTAPAIALACFALDPKDIVFVTPSDHIIKNEDEYIKVVKKAKELAKKNYLVTFGIEPIEPNIGYGYIESRIEDAGFSDNGLDVVKFHEKPDAKTARQYLTINSQTPNLKPHSYYFWNSGMFCFKAGVFLEELQKYAPEIYEASKKAFENSTKDEAMYRIKHNDMADIPEDSIDYAVMEQSDKVKVVLADIDWSDLGSFDALVNECNMQSDNYYEVDSKNNFYYSDDNRKVITTIGLEDFIVIDTKDALFISKKGQTQKVKDIIKQLPTTHYPLLTTHSTVHRPWGTYTLLEERKKYKIKRIVVKPGKRLSLQKHFHRSEHWIVVEGTALVTVEEKEVLIRPNESTYIPMGEMHRLENPGKVDVVIIEAQVGEYLDEDDIVRIEDDFEGVICR